MTNETILVQDGDELAFIIASACEKRSIKAVNSTNDAFCVFKHRTELKKFLTGLEVPEEFFIVSDLQEADDISSAIHTIKVRLNNFKETCEADELEIYLSGKDNFRNFIPLPTQYKSKRKDLIKPLLLQEIRDYLVSRYGAEVVNGREVDDKVCERMWDGYISHQKIIGSTIDKDAKGCAGWLYDTDKMMAPEFIQGLGSLWLEESTNAKGKVETTVRGKGRIWMYTQWLMGDPTDDYNPCEICKVKFGEKSAYKLLKDCTTDTEAVQVVYDTYKKWYPAEVKYTSWEDKEIVTDVFGIMQMYLDCARMRRWADDTLDVKDLLTKLGVKHD